MLRSSEFGGPLPQGWSGREQMEVPLQSAILQGGCKVTFYKGVVK